MNDPTQLRYLRFALVLVGLIFTAILTPRGVVATKAS
jgi:hypothetical protein